MADSKPDLDISSGAWINLVANWPDLSGMPVELQARFAEGPTYVVFGGSAPASLTAGIKLAQDERVFGSASAIWVRAGMPPAIGGDVPPASLSVRPSIAPPPAVLTPVALAANTAFDARLFADVEFQIDTAAACTVQRGGGADGAGTFYAWSAWTRTGAELANTSAAGIYSTDGGTWLKFSQPVILWARG